MGGKVDSILLEGPDETTMLIDSEPRQDHGETVLKHLDEHDIDHIDHLITTHYDADHIGGHAEIIESFGPERIETVHGPQWEEIEPQDTKTVGQFRYSLHSRLCPLRGQPCQGPSGSQIHRLRR